MSAGNDKTMFATTRFSLPERPRTPSEEKRHWPGVSSGMYFGIYRADDVTLTSTLRGGGDWNWRFCQPDGTVLAECGGYPNRADCESAIECLRQQAASAEIRAAVGSG